MKLDIFNNTSPNATAKDAIGARLHDRGTGTCCYGATEAEAIEQLCKYVDRDQVNSLLQSEERVSTAIERFAVHTGALLLSVFVWTMLVFSIATPDERVTGWMSNDAPVMEAK